MTSRPLFGMTLEELSGLADGLGLPPFAARQLADWLYVKGAGSVEAMTNLPKPARARLAAGFPLGRAAPEAAAESGDGVRKYRFAAGRGRCVESAWIPDRGRSTLCVSSQVGCRRACRFCATGRAGFGGNLNAGQILNQLASIPERNRVTNLVFMGMGEPLDNPDAVLPAIRILTAPWGFGWSPARITVSTIGVRPAIERLLAGARCHVALSLHSPFPDERAALVPAERRHPVGETLDLLRRSGAFAGQRRLTIEIAMLRGVNDSERHARETARLLRGLRCRVNLIPFNPAPGLPFEPSRPETVAAYQARLRAAGRTTTIRRSRGADIGAACGLLAATGNAGGRRAGLCA